MGVLFLKFSKTKWCLCSLPHSTYFHWN